MWWLLNRNGVIHIHCCRSGHGVLFGFENWGNPNEDGFHTCPCFGQTIICLPVGAYLLAAALPDVAGTSHMPARR